MQRHGSALNAREHLGVERVQVAHVVVDLAQPVFARHPRGADLALAGRYRRVLQVEARQRLRRDEQPPAVRQRLEVPQEPARQLPVAVAHEPDLANRGARSAQRVVAGGARDAEAVFLHYVTRMVTISCGAATNLTRCPRPSSTSANDSRSSARTRCALLTPSPKRQAPATLRLVAL